MIILNLSRGWRKIMRGVNFCPMLSDERIEYNFPHRFKNKKAAPPRSISERSEQPFLSVSRVYNDFTDKIENYEYK